MKMLGLEAETKRFVFNHPFTSDMCYDRLISEAEKYNNNIIVGFDFDHTIFNHREYADKLEDLDNAEEMSYQCIVDLLKGCKDVGMTLVLYTAEKSEERLELKKEFCKRVGIEYDYVNESPIMNGTNKPYFNILLDDRAGLQEAFNILSKVVMKLSDQKL